MLIIDTVPSPHGLTAPTHAEGLPKSRFGSVLDHRTGVILVVEDNPHVREALHSCLEDEGHIAVVAQDAAAAMTLVMRGTTRPDLILADYKLPDGLDGVRLALQVRDYLGEPTPVIILTGDISITTSRHVAGQMFHRCTKPVKLPELAAIIQTLFGATPPARQRCKPLAPSEPQTSPVVFVVDEDPSVCCAISNFIEIAGYRSETYATAEGFLAAYRPGNGQTLLIDACPPTMSGIGLLQRLRDCGHYLPSIVISGQSDVPMAVAAMKAGAVDFIEKPIRGPHLVASISRALERAQDLSVRIAQRQGAVDHIDCLTLRQREIMALVLCGQPSKNIAADLGISQRTVENHRASIMHRTGADSIPALARMALVATWSRAGLSPSIR